jgi:hypothetical protein
MAEQERIRIVYVKPQAVDVGSTAPIVGASCYTGGSPATAETECYIGNVATNCHVGASASGDCNVGDSH